MSWSLTYSSSIINPKNGTGKRMHEEWMFQLKAIVNEHETQYLIGMSPAHAAGPNKGERSQCNKMFHLYLLYTHCVMWMKSYAFFSVKLNIKTIDICIIIMKIVGYKSDLQWKYKGFRFNSIIFLFKCMHSYSTLKPHKVLQ